MNLSYGNNSRKKSQKSTRIRILPLLVTYTPDHPNHDFMLHLDISIVYDYKVSRVQLSAPALPLVRGMGESVRG
jgi:hypothetical protein